MLASTVEEPDVKETWRQPLGIPLTTASSNKATAQRVVLADKGTSKHKHKQGAGVFVKRYVAAQLVFDEIQRLTPTPQPL